MAVLHVIPDDRKATWRVLPVTARVPLEHTTATAAETAALSEAEERREVDAVVIHDRYHRTHWVELRSRAANDETRQTSRPNRVPPRSAYAPRA